MEFPPAQDAMLMRSRNIKIYTAIGVLALNCYFWVACIFLMSCPTFTTGALIFNLIAFLTLLFLLFAEIPSRHAVKVIAFCILFSTAISLVFYVTHVREIYHKK